MTIKKLKNVSLRLLCLLVLTLTFMGCIREETADCEDVYALTIRAYNASGEELSGADVKDVTLFIFDKDACFISKTQTAIGRSIQIKAPSGEELQIVAWGNLTDGMQTCTEPVPGDPLDGCFVNLSDLTRAASDMRSPGDLFRGRITLTPQNGSSEAELPMYREVGSMAITIRSLKFYTGLDDDDYSIVVRETPSRISFDGILSGGGAVYHPQGSFAKQDEYCVPAFNLLPEGALHIDIYHGTQLIMTVSQDNAGNPFAVEKGRLTNVLIDLKASLSVSMSVNDWGDTQVWKEF